MICRVFSEVSEVMGGTTRSSMLISMKSSIQLLGSLIILGKPPYGETSKRSRFCSGTMIRLSSVKKRRVHP